jgi:hypothetical protein
LGTDALPQQPTLQQQQPKKEPPITILPSPAPGPNQARWKSSRDKKRDDVRKERQQHHLASLETAAKKTTLPTANKRSNAVDDTRIHATAEVLPSETADLVMIRSTGSEEDDNDLLNELALLEARGRGDSGPSRSTSPGNVPCNRPSSRSPMSAPPSPTPSQLSMNYPGSPTFNRSNSPYLRPPAVPTPTAADDSSMSSSVGEFMVGYPTNTSLQRITAAIKSQSHRPPGLTIEEKTLWDAVQVAVARARHYNPQTSLFLHSGSAFDSRNSSGSHPPLASGHGTKEASNDVKADEPTIFSQWSGGNDENTSVIDDESTGAVEVLVLEHQDGIGAGMTFVAASSGTEQPTLDPTKVSASSWEGLYRELQNQASIQEKEHTRALRAIQRVLADVSAERDHVVERLESSWRSKSPSTSPPPEFDEGNFTSLSAVGSETDERDRSVLLQELESAQRTIVELKQEKQALQMEFETKGGQLQIQHQGEQNEPEVGSTEVPETNRLPAGLEVDSTVVSRQVYERQRIELDEKKEALENAKMIITSLENASGSLAADMRLKLKAKDDELSRLKLDAVDRKRTMEALADELREVNRGVGANSPANGAEDYSESGPLVHELRLQLEAKTAAQKRLENHVRRLKNEAVRIQVDCDRSLQQKDVELDFLRSEVDRLRQECSANLEALTRKERELGVLRDSLKVDEDEGMGYISDDASEGSDEDFNGIDSQISATPSKLSNVSMGTAQVEALASFIAHQGGSRSFDLGHSSIGTGNKGMPMLEAATREIEAMKRELEESRKEREKVTKALRSEKESLSNAKMIISALEKSNKSMTEDLRSRLQDSNTAITSLLAKSMESERNNSALRKALEKERKDQQQREESLRKELEQLRVTTREHIVRFQLQHENAQRLASSSRDSESPTGVDRLTPPTQRFSLQETVDMITPPPCDDEDEELEDHGDFPLDDCQIPHSSSFAA